MLLPPFGLTGTGNGGGGGAQDAEEVARDVNRNMAEDLRDGGRGAPAAAAALQRHRCAKETLVSFLLGLRLSLPLQMSTRGLPLNSAPSISHMLSAALLASDEKARE